MSARFYPRTHEANVRFERAPVLGQHRSRRRHHGHWWFTLGLVAGVALEALIR